MKKQKGSEILPRPAPPTPENIKEDIQKASDDDPVFTLAHKLFGADEDARNQKDGSEEQMDSDANCGAIEHQYVKVCDLLSTISSLKNGRRRIDHACLNLLNSKEEVSAVALELKIRLEKHKTMSSKDFK